jgi:hypothetical protein
MKLFSFLLIFFINIYPLFVAAQIKLSPRKEFVKPLAYPSIIKGIAPAYIGLEIQFFQIEDYISQKEVLLGTAIVGQDSLFKTTILIDCTQRINVKVGRAKGYMYAEPKANYGLYLKNRSSEVKGLQADLNISFLGLDQTDINYKILDYTDWENRFLSRNYIPVAGSNFDFMKVLDTFKTKVEDFYAKDSSDFLKQYVKFSLANLDNLEFEGARNKFEKYDFYVKFADIYYENDVYMRYINSFYKKFIPMATNAVNQAMYKGTLASSPKLIMQAMGKDYCLDNLRLRELIMIKSLTEVYYTGDFPQTNILEVLDSVAKFALFEKNKIIAKNCMDRLTELNPGSNAPEFGVTTFRKEVKTLKSYAGKHLYISFVDQNAATTISEIKLLESLQRKYGAYVQFLTIVKPTKDSPLKMLSDLPWDVYYATEVSSILSKYKIVTFPSYVFIDAMGDIVSAQALKPSPNAKGDNIDKVFFSLATLIEYDKNKDNTGKPKGR